MSRLTRPGQAALIVATAAVLIRCLLLLHNYTPDKVLALDSSGYERPAISFLKMGRFLEAGEIQEFVAKLYGSAPSTQPRPMFLRTPGYPLFLAAIYSFGADRRGMVIVQIFLSGLGVWLTYLLGKQIVSAWAGVLAAILVAVDPVTVWCSQIILTETVFSVLLLAAALAGVALLRRPAWRWSLSLGILLGVATLFKPVTYYLPIAICAALLFRRVPIKLLAGMLAAFVLLVGCWQVRNLKVVGTGTFSGAAGWNLLMWGAAGIVAQQQGIDLEAAQGELVRRLPDPSTLSASELDEIYSKAGKQAIRSHPILCLHDIAKGMIVLLGSPGARLLSSFFGLPAAPFVTAYIIFLAAIYLALAVQVTAMWGGGEIATHSLTAVIVIYLIVLQSGAGSGCRYRVPAMPFLAVYAAGGILRMKRARSLRRPTSARQAGSKNPGLGPVGRLKHTPPLTPGSSWHFAGGGPFKRAGRPIERSFQKVRTDIA